MLNPIKVEEFDKVTIGYFDWLVDKKYQRVIRFVGMVDGKCIDQVFQPGVPIGLAVHQIIDTVKRG